MGSFMPEGAEGDFSGVFRGGGNGGGGLVSVVKPLSVSAKKAMYAAAQKGLIKRRSWNGCAFNAAGSAVGDDGIASSEAAAKLFDMPSSRVDNFIRVWDSMSGTDEECTRRLVRAIEEVGITCEPTVKGRVTRVIRGYAFKSKETQFKEELEAIETIDDLPSDMQAGIRSAEALLNAVS